MNRFYVDPAASRGAVEGIGSILGGLARRQQNQQMQQLAQANKARMQEAIKIFESGDADAISSFMLQNPDMQNAVIKAQQFRNDATKAKRIESLQRIALGEPVSKVAEEAAQFIRSEGGTPEQTEAFGRLPQDVAQKRAMSELALVMEPQQYKAFSESMGVMSAPELQRIDIEREKLNVRKLENEQRSLDRVLSRETNELKREELKLKIDERQTKLDESKKAIADSVSKKSADSKATRRLVDEMITHPGLNKAVGLSSILPTAPGGKAADYEVMLDTLKSKQFLNEIQKMKGMGALSNAEGEKIAAAAEALSLSQSEDAHRKALKQIKDGLATIDNPGTYNKQSNQISEGTVIRNPKTGQTMILRNNQWVAQ